MKSHKIHAPVTTTQKWFQDTRDSARYSPFDSSGATVAAEVALGRGTTQRLGLDRDICCGTFGGNPSGMFE